MILIMIRVCVCVCRKIIIRICYATQANTRTITEIHRPLCILCIRNGLSRSSLSWDGIQILIAVNIVNHWLWIMYSTNGGGPFPFGIEYLSTCAFSSQFILFSFFFRYSSSFHEVFGPLFAFWLPSLKYSMDCMQVASYYAQRNSSTQTPNRSTEVSFLMVLNLHIDLASYLTLWMYEFLSLPTEKSRQKKNEI